MKFQNPILNFEQTDGCTDGQAKSNVPLQLFQSWGHKKHLPSQFQNEISTIVNVNFKVGFDTVNLR